MQDGQSEHSEKATCFVALTPEQKMRLRAAFQLLMEYVMKNRHRTYSDSSVGDKARETAPDSSADPPENAT